MSSETGAHHSQGTFCPTEVRLSVRGTTVCRMDEVPPYIARGPRVVVLDTGALAHDVLQGSRGPRLTSLLMALDQPGTRGFVTAQIVEEVERDLVRIVPRTDDLSLVRRRWGELYLPRLVIVDVIPEAWGRSDTRVQAVYATHVNDGPLAQLAATVAPCSLFAEDSDLINTIGATKNWTPLSHAFANEAAYEQNVIRMILTGQLTGALGGAAVKAALRLPSIVQYVLLVAGGLALTNAHQRGRLRMAGGKVWELMGSVVETYGPSLEQFMSWLDNAQEVRHEHELAPLSTPTVGEQVARVLAVAAEPMSAPEIAQMLNLPGSVGDRTVAVRSALLQHPQTL